MQKVGKMSGSGNEARVQPGRVMIVLKDALVTDDVVYEIADQYGNIKSIHRPGNNQQLIFIQFEDPDSAVEAIEKMRNYPIFRAVDMALRSERFSNDNDNNSGNQTNQNQKPKNFGGKMHHNNMQGNRQKPGHGSFNNSVNNANNNNNSGNTGSEYPNDRSFSSQESDSPPKPIPEIYQPEIPLGCWHCTKMPSFECQCGAYYCDANCQRANWAQHKVVCMPRLVPISYSNQRMLQEAAASKKSASISSGPSQEGFHSQQQQRSGSNDHNSYGGQQQQQQYQNNRTSVTSRLKQPKNQANKTQNSQQQRNGSANSHTNRDLERNSTRDHQQTKNSPEESGKVTQLGNKLQLLKLKKSTSTGKNRILQAGQFPREGSRIKITSSLPSGVVYIYHNNAHNGQSSDYFVLASKLYQAASKAKPLNEIPKIDDVIFAPFQGGFYRGKVLAVKGDQLEVHYPDFGNMETIAWKEAKEIGDEELKWAKYLTFPVKLEGVGMLTSEMKNVLEELEETEELELVKAHEMADSPLKDVVLRRPKETTTLNMQLMELKEQAHRQKVQREEQKERERKEKAQKELEEQKKQEQAAKIADPTNYQPVLFDDSMEIKQLPLDCKQQLLIIDASELLETHIISVIAVDNLAKYGAVVEDCGTLGPADPNPYQPREEGEVVLVLHENDWTRALYDIAEENFMLLDVGIIASVPKGNVRRFPPGLGRVVFNNEVIVENLPVLKKIMTDDKPDSLHGKQIDAWVCESEGGIGLRIIGESPK